MSDLKTFSKDAVVYGLGSGIKKFIGLFLVPFYTRALTPADFGILDTMASGIVLTFTLFNLGLDSATSYYFYRIEDKKEQGSFLFTAFVIRLITVVPCLFLTFFAKAISVALFGSDQYTLLVLISCMIIPINLLMIDQEHVYRFYRLPWKYNILTIMKALINVGLGITLVLIYKKGILGAQIATFLSSTIVIIFSFVFYTRKIYHYKFNITWAKKIIKYGFPIVWGGIAVWVYSLSNRFFLLHYKSLTQIGYYSIGDTFSQPILLINMAVQMSYNVLFFSIYNQEKGGEKIRSRKLASDTVKLFLMVTISIALFLSIFSSDILRLITTPKYLPGAIIIPILTFSYITSQLYQIINVGIFLSEKTWNFTLILVISSIANVGSNFLLIPRFGYIGAAFANLISYATCLFLGYLIAQHYFRISYQIRKLTLYLVLGFITAISVPFLEINYNIHLHFLLKTLLFLAGLTLPVVLSILTIKKIKQEYIPYVVSYARTKRNSSK